MAEALYRKYRPQVFGDVVGQDHIERTLRNAIEQDKVSHAYLFCGPRGTGKTTTARLLAKALLCEKAPTPEPDGTCPECRAIAAGEHPDVYELDAASRTGVENVREEIIGRVQFAPTRGARKVYIIDEVHMLSTAAFNALLKTLEEPPSHVVFILCTTDPQKVPETIHSRCQRFDFRRISPEEMVTRLGAICVSEGVEFEGDALDLIAHRADGGMRNALTALEQAIAYGAGKVTLATVESLVGSLDTSDLAEIVTAIGRRDVPACFAWTASYVETGADLAQFTRDLAEHVRNMYVLSVAGADAPADVSEAERREISEELELFGSDRLARMLGVLGDLASELRSSTNARLSFEIALTRMVRPEADLTLASLAERIEELERRLAAGGAPAVPMPAVAAPAADAGAPSLEPAAAAASPKSQEVPAVSTPAPEPQTVETAPAAASAASGSASPNASGTAPSALRSTAASPGAIGDELAAQLANPAVLQRAWQAAVASIKREKTAYAALLVTARAAFDPATRALSIEFPAESAFAFKAVQRPEVVEAISDALAAALGQRTAFTFAQAHAGGVSPASAAAAASGASFAASRDGDSASSPAPTGGEDPAARMTAAPAKDSPSAFGRSGDARQAGASSPSAYVQASASSHAGGRSDAEPVSIAEPAPAAEPAPGAQGGSAAVPAGDPSRDEVPVDLYDEVPIDLYDEAGWAPEPSPQPEPQPAPSATATASGQGAPQPVPDVAASSPEPQVAAPASASAFEPQRSASAPQPIASTAASSSPEPQSGAPIAAASDAPRESAGGDAAADGAEALAQLLSSSFGSGVVVREV